jgi:acetyl esterase/lipase
MSFATAQGLFARKPVQRPPPGSIIGKSEPWARDGLKSRDDWCECMANGPRACGPTLKAESVTRVSAVESQRTSMKTSRGISRALPILALSLCISARGTPQPGPIESADVSAIRRHLGTQGTVGDILRHPAFAGFGHLILPWDNRAYDESLPLTRIGSLLPYHTHIDPETVANALNRMIDEAAAGRTVFYSFYSEEQKKQQPAKRNTGLFFYRGSPGAPFAVIAPGGGFSYVGSLHEGFPYAEAIGSKGYNAFVLRYRAGYGGAPATEDLAAAVSYILRNASALGVGATGYSLWGSSAGARMAAAIGSHGVARYGGSDVARPAAIVMAYTAHSDYSSAEPPTFVAVGEQDGIAPPSSMEARVGALRRSGTKVEYHKYKNLGHGFGLGTGTSAEGWVFEAIRFWETAIRRSR